ncbi:hypothetical protein HDU77_006167 [Chytriomyces hyalinus]|nr:hypothetical protein HDU77_006167 [Chytriomyces hyalinus]
MLYFFLNFGLGPHLDEFANKVKGIKDTKNLAYEAGIQQFYMIAGFMFSVGYEQDEQDEDVGTAAGVAAAKEVAKALLETCPLFKIMATNSK